MTICRKQALWTVVVYLGVTIGQLFFFYQKVLFGRDVLSEWFDRHIGTWSDSPRSGPSNTPGSPHELPKFRSHEPPSKPLIPGWSYHD